MAEQMVADALADTPVVIVVGPRQCGKSTLAMRFGEGREYVTLDDPVFLAHATENPADFLLAHPAPLIIDEIQRAPGLFLLLKLMVDKNRKPGSYILTGSANVLLLPKVADSLAGRMEIIDLQPLSQGEIERTTTNWVDSVFSDLISLQTSQTPTSLEDRIVRGGYPEPAQRAAKRRDPWFQSYIRTLLDRDVRDLANIDGLTQLPKLLRLLAARAGTPLNLSGLSRETNLPHTSITRYVDLLKALYLIRTVPAWSADAEVKLARTPKAYLVDTGLACHLNQIDEKQLSRSGDLRSAMLETFLANELLRLIQTAEVSADLFHLRTVKNKEIPFLIEARDGRIVAIDFQDQAAPSPQSIERLNYVKEVVGDNFHRGIWMHTGTDAKALTSDIHAVPISCLWS
jgi:predicted AAA+ superfamily ATPase